MTTKMVIYFFDGNSRVLDFRGDYTDFKIEDGILTIYNNNNIKLVYAKNYWKSIEFNRPQLIGE